MFKLTIKSIWTVVQFAFAIFTVPVALLTAGGTVQPIEVVSRMYLWLWDQAVSLFEDEQPVATRKPTTRKKP